MGDVIYNNGGSINKFIGDAILAFFPDKKKDEMKKIGESLIGTYRQWFSQSGALAIGKTKKGKIRTDLAIGVKKPKRVLKGFVGSSSYVDYSYWGPHINILFKKLKEKKEGEVHFF
jgi:class 3 adenylate cyclase